MTMLLSLCVHEYNISTAQKSDLKKLKMHRQQKRQSAISSVVHGEFEPQLLTPLILCGWSFDKLSAGILLIH